MTKILACDHGEARCGLAVSDPTQTLATPLGVVVRPQTDRGLSEIAKVVAEESVERVVVGLPRTLSGSEGEQARSARAFAQALEGFLSLPVELYDERFTSRMADAHGGKAPSDARAAAHLLTSYLDSVQHRG
jgi:putative holliday junction resolvase